MKDFILGNRIYQLRRDNNYTQGELAIKLGVTDKAISKWENGSAKPSIDNIRELASIFDISIDELLDLNTKPKEKKKITKIVLTGGPCAGKSTAMNWIQNFFQKQGYYVLFVPETATELILGGLTPWTTEKSVDFQRCVLHLQLEKERIFEEGIKYLPYDKILVVCDRGTLDSKAYVSRRDFNYLLKSEGLSEVKLRDSYDAVFHLVTAAKGAEAFYNLDNQARTETIEEACLCDTKLIDAWTGHPHLRIIDNSTNFEDKMKRLIKGISDFIGEPEPYEIERKFLIKYPDTELLSKLPNCEKVQIVQTYLIGGENEEIRIRQRGINGNYTYSETKKINISPVKRIELEERLTQEEYLNRLSKADPTKGQIIKDRYCLSYNNQYFEIDIYPFWDDVAICEIELNDEEEEISIPEYIEVIKEVTDNLEYRNSKIAEKILTLS